MVRVKPGYYPSPSPPPRATAHTEPSSVNRKSNNAENGTTHNAECDDTNGSSSSSTEKSSRASRSSSRAAAAIDGRDNVTTRKKTTKSPVPSSSSSNACSTPGKTVYLPNHTTPTKPVHVTLPCSEPRTRSEYLSSYVNKERTPSSQPCPDFIKNKTTPKSVRQRVGPIKPAEPEKKNDIKVEVAETGEGSGRMTRSSSRTRAAGSSSNEPPAGAEGSNAASANEPNPDANEHAVIPEQRNEPAAAPQKHDVVVKILRINPTVKATTTAQAMRMLDRIVLTAEGNVPDFDAWKNGGQMFLMGSPCLLFEGDAIPDNFNVIRTVEAQSSSDSSDDMTSDEENARPPPRKMTRRQGRRLTADQAVNQILDNHSSDDDSSDEEGPPPATFMRITRKRNIPPVIPKTEEGEALHPPKAEKTVRIQSPPGHVGSSASTREVRVTRRNPNGQVSSTAANREARAARRNQNVQSAPQPVRRNLDGDFRAEHDHEQSTSAQGGSEKRSVVKAVKKEAQEKVQTRNRTPAEQNGNDNKDTGSDSSKDDSSDEEADQLYSPLKKLKEPEIWGRSKRHPKARSTANTSNKRPTDADSSSSEEEDHEEANGLLSGSSEELNLSLRRSTRQLKRPTRSMPASRTKRRSGRLSAAERPYYAEPAHIVTPRESPTREVTMRQEPQEELPAQDHAHGEVAEQPDVDPPAEEVPNAIGAVPPNVQIAREIKEEPQEEPRPEEIGAADTVEVPPIVPPHRTKQEIKQEPGVVRVTEEGRWRQIFIETEYKINPAHNGTHPKRTRCRSPEVSIMVRGNGKKIPYPTKSHGPVIECYFNKTGNVTMTKVIKEEIEDAPDVAAAAPVENPFVRPVLTALRYKNGEPGKYKRNPPVGHVPTIFGHKRKADTKLLKQLNDALHADETDLFYAVERADEPTAENLGNSDATDEHSGPPTKRTRSSTGRFAEEEVRANVDCTMQIKSIMKSSRSYDPDEPGPSSRM